VTARSCPTCRGITTTPRLIEHDGQGAFPCPDRWHTVTALLDDQGRETPTANLPGFDPADPSTWHPMHGTVASPMQRAYKMLGVRPGTDMAPAIEHLARTLFPPAAAAGSNALDDSAERLGRQLAVTKAHYQRRCELLTERRELLGDEVDRITAENERLRGLVGDAIDAGALNDGDTIDRIRREAGLT